MSPNSCGWLKNKEDCGFLQLLKQNTCRCAECKQKEVFFNWNSSEPASQPVSLWSHTSRIPAPVTLRLQAAHICSLDSSYHFHLSTSPSTHFDIFPLVWLIVLQLHTFHWSSSASPHFYCANRKILLTQTLLAETLLVQILLTGKLLARILPTQTLLVQTL